MVYAAAVIPTNVSNNQILKDFIIDLGTISKLITFSTSNMPLIEKENKLFVCMFGGEAVIETHNVSDKPYKDKPVINPSQIEEELDLEGEYFIELLESLRILAQSGTRAEERAVYFDGEFAYVYSGIVVGRFPVKFVDVALQLSDVDSILCLFKGVSKIKVQVTETTVIFSAENRRLHLNKRKLKLADEIKDTNIDITSGVRVDSKAIFDVVNVLDYMPSNSGIINLISKDYGFDIISPQRNGENNSTFPIQSTLIGSGFTSSVRLSLKEVKTYMRSFKGIITLGVRGEKLFISGDIGAVSVSGDVVNK
jgi:hypothetical protein